MKSSFYFFCIFLLAALIGCKDESEQSQLLLKNDLNTAIEVTVFPNSKYSSSSGMYKSSPIYNGYGLTKFNIKAGEQYELFTDYKTTISADSMMRMVFDSIKVTTDIRTLQFDHISANGYEENLFKSNPGWTLMDETIEAGTQFKRKKIYSSNSYFTFVEELINP